MPGLKLAGAVDLWDCPDRDKDAGVAAGVVRGRRADHAPISAAVLPGCRRRRSISARTTAPPATPRAWPSAGKALVIGTTGLTADEKNVVGRPPRKIPVVAGAQHEPGREPAVRARRRRPRRRSRARATTWRSSSGITAARRIRPAARRIGLGEAAARGYGLGSEEGRRARARGPGRRAAGGADRVSRRARRGHRRRPHGAVRGGRRDASSSRTARRAATRLPSARCAPPPGSAGRAPGLYSMRDVLGV